MKVGIFKKSFDYAHKISNNLRTRFYIRPLSADEGDVLQISSLNPDLA